MPVRTHFLDARSRSLVTDAAPVRMDIRSLDRCTSHVPSCETYDLVHVEELAIGPWIYTLVRRVGRNAQILQLGP